MIIIVPRKTEVSFEVRKMFQGLTELFDALTDTEYVVLRNYEEFDDLNFLSSHPDIDFLCANRKELVERLALRPRRKREDGIHYYTKIGEKKVAIDLRCVGDGYLDTTWEQHIIENRKIRENYYVMDLEDYYYSLLYHVTIQKDKVAEDYVNRLGDMAAQLETTFDPDRKEQILDAYMEEKGYRYTYPEYPGTIFHISKVNPDLVEKSRIKMTKRKLYRGICKVFKGIRSRKNG